MPDAPDIDFGTPPHAAPDIDFGGGATPPSVPPPPDQSEPGRLESIGYGLAAGVPFSDRATAAAEAAFGSGTYSGNLARIRQEHEAAYKAHPWLYTGSELAGGAAAFSLFPEGELAEGALAGAGRGALSGAGIGAVYGASEAKDFTKPKETAASIGSGALGGALIGAPLGAASGYLQGKASTAAKVLSPDIVGEGKQAAGTIREETGEAARATTQAATKLEEHTEANRSLQGGATARDATATNGTRFTPATKTFMDYLDGVGPEPTDPAHKAFAEEIKPLFKDRRDRMEALGLTDIQMRENYWPILLETEGKGEPIHAGAPGTGAAPGLGGTGFTKTRHYETTTQAVAAGEKFKTFDVKDIAYSRLAGEDRFIAVESVLKKGRDNGYIKKFDSAQDAAKEGYAALKARGPYPSGEYAPEDWARVYNAFASKLPSGFAGNALAGFRKASAFTTSFELGMSGYHAGVMTQESIISDVARAAMQAATPGMRGKAVKTLLASPAAPYTRSGLGGVGAKIYSGIDVQNASPETRRVVDLLTRAGARMATGGKQRSIDVETSRAGSLAHANIRAFTQALAGGATKTEAVGAQLKSIGAGIGRIPGNVAGAYRATEGNPLKIAKTTLSGVGRILSTTTGPLFDEYIPRLKNGAMMTQMADWIAANPGATEEAALTQARKVVNSVDNRFGEMVQDNIFWHQNFKHGLMGAMVSYSWNLGTARELGGGLADIGMMLRGKKSLSLAAGDETSYKAAYTIALPIVWGMFAGAYQYLHGQGPLLTMQDYFAPRTGGTSQVTNAQYKKEPVPERLSTVGYMKEVHGIYNDIWLNASPWKYGYGKTSAFIQTTVDLMSNRDWRGKPIVDPNAPGSAEIVQLLGHALGNLAPITLKSELQAKPGTHMGFGERAMGFRPAAQDLLDPEAAAGWRTEEYKRGLPADERKAYGKKGPWGNDARDIDWGR